jgi:D-lactate dehydrogenase (cytochrome)
MCGTDWTFGQEGDAMPPASSHQKALNELERVFGSRFSVAQSIREHHSRDESVLAPALPDCVIFPRTTAEVAAALAVCSRHALPVIPFGAGSSLEGQVLATVGGVALSTTEMQRIVQVNQEDLDVVVQPGVTRGQLNAVLQRQGLFFSVDPGADATIGGMLATRASGTTTVMYGTMKDNVLGLEVVLPDGRVIRTGTRARKSSAGYDLTRLFVGSEGTLGVITEATLRLRGIPEEISAGVCAFHSIGDAVASVIQILQMGVPVARVELLNESAIGAINSYEDLSYQVAPTLFFEFHGSPGGVRDAVDSVAAVTSSNAGSKLQWEIGREGRDRLWRARHNAYFASLALRPNCRALTTDVCVPISCLRACIEQTEADLADLGMPSTIVGHIGDGNFHVILLLDPSDPKELDEAHDFYDRLIDRALEMGGTCTGEHGIGLGKKRYLVKELGEATEVMRAIKRALDPTGVMNPGKVL